MVILIDTSIFIDFTRQQAGIYLQLVKEAATYKYLLTTSSMVLFEYWSGQSMKKARAVRFGNELFKPISITSVSAVTARRAGELRRNLQLEQMDALIAATALETGAVLATLNTTHFKKVPGLKLWQPTSAP